MKRRTLASLPLIGLLGSQLGEPAAADAGIPQIAPEVMPVAAAPPTIMESPGIVAGNLPAFFEQLKAELTYPLAWGNSPIRNFRAWKRAAAGKVGELLWQRPDATPFQVEVVDEQPGDGYVQRMLLFNVTRHSRVRATMLVPNGTGPFPAALLLHDHGAKFDIGKEKLIRPWYDEARLASAQAWSTRFFSDRFPGNVLAQRGYAVLAVDVLGWGDRSGLTYEAQQGLASNFFNLGASLSGLMAREDVRAAAMLATLPEVDSRRIAAVGFSMGAYRSWQVAALSPHISAAISVCWMTTLKEMMVVGNNTLRGQSALFMLHPGLYSYLDIPDVASIAAPKPSLFFNGELDTLFPPAGVNAAYEKMRRVWRSQHAHDRLVTRLWPGVGHSFFDQMQDEAFSWLDTVIR